MTIPAGPTTKKPATGKFGAWIQSHKKQAGFGAAAIGVVGLALFRKKSSSAAAATSTSAIDPATGLPYSEELAAAQTGATTSPASDSGYYGSGSGGGGYGDNLGTDITGLDTAISSLQAQIAGNGTGATGTATINPGGPEIPAGLVTPSFIQPTPESGVTPVAPSVPVVTAPVISAPATQPIAANQSDAAAAAAYASGQETAEAALQSEVPASAETAAQRHAQELANKSLRAAAK